MTRQGELPEAHGATRVALIGCSGVLGDVIRKAINASADLAVVDDRCDDGLAEFSATMREVCPDVLVWQLRGEPRVADRPEFCGGEGGFAVLAVIDDGRRGVLWRLHPQRMALDPLSSEGLVGAIRTAAHAEIATSSGATHETTIGDAQ